MSTPLTIALAMGSVAAVTALSAARQASQSGARVTAIAPDDHPHHRGIYLALHDPPSTWHNARNLWMLNPVIAALGP